MAHKRRQGDPAEMETVARATPLARRTACDVPAWGTSPTNDSKDRALVELARGLKERGYLFTTVTPASHARILSRAPNARPSLTDIFGWNRPFAAGDVSEDILTRMADAGVLHIAGSAFRSNVRFSTLGSQLFAHSPFPTKENDAVFFGPDTYRFARLICQSLGSKEPQGGGGRLRILDVGAGSGAGGLYAASLLAQFKPTITLTDISRRALRFCKLNTDLNEVRNVQIVESDLFNSVNESFDFIVANPPYLVDPSARLYRHGGGEFGFDLSLRIVEQGISRLAYGGRLLLYTGSVIVDGRDLFHDVLLRTLAPRGVEFSYEEIDPDVFGEELNHSPYDRADRIAVVSVTIDVT